MKTATKLRHPEGTRDCGLRNGEQPDSGPAPAPNPQSAIRNPQSEEELLARVNSIGIECVVITLLDMRDGQGAHLHTERREDAVRGADLAERCGHAARIVESAAELRLHFLRRAAESLREREAAQEAAALVEAEE